MRELFSFRLPPARLSHPKAKGLRHLAFVVNDINSVVAELAEKGIAAEPARTDEFTGKKFTFIADPERLSFEGYQH